MRLIHRGQHLGQTHGQDLNEKLNFLLISKSKYVEYCWLGTRRENFCNYRVSQIFFTQKKQSGTPWICDHFDIRPHRLMVILMAAFILSEKPVYILFNLIR